MAALALSTAPASAATDIWTQSASGGFWNTASNPPWSTSAVPGATDTADFSTLLLPANNTVHLDGTSESVGAMIFGDQGNTYNWTLDSTSGTLTLGGSASVTVDNGTATISAPCSAARPG